MRQRRQRGRRFAFNYGFVARYDRERRAYPAISLAAHGGDLTAIGNDYSFVDLFARQVEAFGLRRCSGRVYQQRQEREYLPRPGRGKDLKVKTIAFLGRDGGKCAGLAEVELLIGGKVTARIQEGHKFLLHTICELVRAAMTSQKRTAVSLRCQQFSGAPHLARFSRDVEYHGARTGGVRRLSGA